MKLGEIIQSYRKDHHLSQRQFATLSEISNGYISMLEKGKNPKTDEPIIPSLAMIKKMADVMGMTLNDLIILADDMKIYLTNEDEISAHEQAVLYAYRTQPDLQPAVDRLLGVYQEDYVHLYVAAHSKDHHPDQIIRMHKEQWEKIKNAPETEDPLL